MKIILIALMLTGCATYQPNGDSDYANYAYAANGIDPAGMTVAIVNSVWQYFHPVEGSEVAQ